MLPTEDIVIEQEEKEITIESRLKEILDIKQRLRTLRMDLKETKENHEEYDELTELKQRVKQLNEKVANDEDIRQLKEKIDDEKDRINLLENIVLVEMENSQINMFDIEDGKFKIQTKKSLKFVKSE